MEAAALEKLRETRNYLNKDTVSEVRAQVNHFGYKITELDSLNVIHIAGTKGKGSTSALCASILKECIVLNVMDGTTRPLKTGFLTSLHLITAREVLAVFLYLRTCSVRHFLSFGNVSLKMK
ncbi:hypothetical protein BDR26DRAFT_913090 [Obelidium mucronatum]|nr:hypothetical protein BDR26DRAFT_913090 [Obelidium mucronatum]